MHLNRLTRVICRRVIVVVFGHSLRNVRQMSYYISRSELSRSQRRERMSHVPALPSDKCWPRRHRRWLTTMSNQRVSTLHEFTDRASGIACWAPPRVRVRPADRWPRRKTARRTPAKIRHRPKPCRTTSRMICECCPWVSARTINTNTVGKYSGNALRNAVRKQGVINTRA